MRAATVIPVALALLGASETPDGAPVEIPELVAGYYQVLRGEEHVGFVHESLCRTATSPEFRYVREEISAPSGPDASESRLRITATVKAETFLPSVVSVERSGDIPSTTDWDVEGGLVRVRDSRLERRGSRELDGAPQILGALLLYELRQRGRLAAVGRLEARLLAWTDGEIREAVLGLEVGETARRPCFSGTATMTRVVFRTPTPLVPGGPELKEAWVDRYGRVAEAFLKAGGRLILVKGEREAHGSFEVRRGGFRKEVR